MKLPCTAAKAIDAFTKFTATSDENIQSGCYQLNGMLHNYNGPAFLTVTGVKRSDKIVMVKMEHYYVMGIPSEPTDLYYIDDVLCEERWLQRLGKEYVWRDIKYGPNKVEYLQDRYKTSYYIDEGNEIVRKESVTVNDHKISSIIDGQYTLHNISNGDVTVSLAYTDEMKGIIDSLDTVALATVPLKAKPADQL